MRRRFKPAEGALSAEVRCSCEVEAQCWISPMIPSGETLQQFVQVDFFRTFASGSVVRASARRSPVSAVGGSYPRPPGGWTRRVRWTRHPLSLYVVVTPKYFCPKSPEGPAPCGPGQFFPSRLSHGPRDVYSRCSSSSIGMPSARCTCCACSSVSGCFLAHAMMASTLK